MDPSLFLDMGVALGLGLLIGMQREWADEEIAGIRTFALIALLGALCALFAEATRSGWILAAGLLSVAVCFWIGNRNRAQVKANGEGAAPGITTEIAGLVTFALGAVAMTKFTAAAVVIGGVVAVLLHWKAPLHGFVDRIGADGFRAIVRLVIIGLVILPVLPDRAYGPYDVLNPHEIWLMVVLIVGISMGAWVVQRLLGPHTGTVVAGVLGGLISSTATTVSYARVSRKRGGRSGQSNQGGAAAAGAIVIMVASTIVFSRVLAEVSVVAPSQLKVIAPPMLVMMAFMTVVAAFAFWRWRSALPEAPRSDQPPGELAPAVIFGLLYAGVLLAVAAVREHFGESALYVVAFISGLTDMDAITLSTAQLAESGRIESDTSWRLILVGAMANLVFKGGAVAVLGDKRLLWRVALLFGVSLAGGVVLLLVWP